MPQQTTPTASQEYSKRLANFKPTPQDWEIYEALQGGFNHTFKAKWGKYHDLNGGPAILNKRRSGTAVVCHLAICDELTELFHQYVAENYSNIRSYMLLEVGRFRYSLPEAQDAAQKQQPIISMKYFIRWAYGAEELPPGLSGNMSKIVIANDEASGLNYQTYYGMAGYKLKELKIAPYTEDWQTELTQSLEGAADFYAGKEMSEEWLKGMVARVNKIDKKEADPQPIAAPAPASAPASAAAPAPSPAPIQQPHSIQKKPVASAPTKKEPKIKKTLKNCKMHHWNPKRTLPPGFEKLQKKHGILLGKNEECIHQGQFMTYAEYFKIAKDFLKKNHLSPYDTVSNTKWGFLEIHLDHVQEFLAGAKLSEDWLEEMTKWANQWNKAPIMPNYQVYQEKRKTFARLGLELYGDESYWPLFWAKASETQSLPFEKTQLYPEGLKFPEFIAEFKWLNQLSQWSQGDKVNLVTFDYQSKAKELFGDKRLSILLMAGNRLNFHKKYPNLKQPNQPLPLILPKKLEKPKIDSWLFGKTTQSVLGDEFILAVGISASAAAAWNLAASYGAFAAVKMKGDEAQVTYGSFETFEHGVSTSAHLGASMNFLIQPGTSDWKGYFDGLGATAGGEISKHVGLDGVASFGKKTTGTMQLSIGRSEILGMDAHFRIVHGTCKALMQNVKYNLQSKRDLQNLQRDLFIHLFPIPAIVPDTLYKYLEYVEY